METNWSKLKLRTLLNGCLINKSAFFHYCSSFLSESQIPVILSVCPPTDHEGQQRLDLWWHRLSCTRVPEVNDEEAYVTDNHFVFLFANTPLRSPVRSSSVTWVWFSISLFSTSRNGRSSALLIGSERLRWTEVMPCEHSSALKCFRRGADLSSGASCVNVSH